MEQPQKIKDAVPLMAEDTKPGRTYRARLFEMIFSDRKALLELYNAVNGTHYDNPELLEINTLKNAIYMSMHNDLSFIIDSQLTLYEHQSTFSPNLPLRCLLYVSDLYSSITRDANLYGTKQVKLPTPRFVIFYNGVKELGDMRTMKLSESFMVEEEEHSLELTAVLLNINPGHNIALKEACQTLKDYSEYSARVRDYAKEMGLEAAVELAIKECIREGILSEFLGKNRAEAKKMSIYEYDEEKHMRQTREEGREEGCQLFLEVYRKLKLGKSVSRIAEELEEDEDTIRKFASELDGDRTEEKKTNIYEYDEEKHMRQTREEGREEGIELGMHKLLKQKVHQKSQKGKPVNQIAEELEESEETIRSLLAELED